MQRGSSAYQQGMPTGACLFDMHCVSEECRGIHLPRVMLAADWQAVDAQHNRVWYNDLKPHRTDGVYHLKQLVAHGQFCYIFTNSCLIKRCMLPKSSDVPVKLLILSMAAPVPEGTSKDLEAFVALSLRQSEVMRLAKGAVVSPTPVKGRVKESHPTQPIGSHLILPIELCCNAKALPFLS